MFGYIKLDKPECKIRAYEYYRAVYCGLCRALGKCGGQCARLTLTYDFTFLALVHMALAGETPQFHKKRCIAHPFFAHAEAKCNPSLTFSANASLLLTGGKLLDDRADEKGRKRLRALCLLPLFRPAVRRARRAEGELHAILTERLSALAAFEKQPARSIDRPALLFGEVMAALLSHTFTDGKATIARAIGLAVGKWVYLVDALDDFDEDARRGRFNPILQVLDGKPLDEETLGQIETALDACLTDASAALDLVDFPDDDMKALCENLLHGGMPSVAKEILTKKEELLRE